MGGLPLAHADSLPVMTWEAGKLEEISVRGAQPNNPWDLYLVGDKKDLRFSASNIGAAGSIIYSIELPKSIGLGSYIVEARSNNALTRQIAGVDIVAMKNFNILQIPKKLIFICTTFIFLIVGLGTLRSARYSRFEYIRPHRPEPENNFLSRFFNLRMKLIDEIQPSLLKFQLVKEGELFHHFSPWIWALAPFSLFSIGAFLGSHPLSYAPRFITPVFTYLIIAIVGVLDPLSGIGASLGFLATLALSGNISNIHSLLSAISFTLGWFTPGLVASIFEEAIKRDWLPLNLQKYTNHVSRVFASTLGGASFYMFELLTNSFTNQFGPVVDPGLLSPCVLGLVIFMRSWLNQHLVRNLHTIGENYQIRSISLPRVISPIAIIVSSLFLFGATYSWTGNISFSILTALISGITLGLLVVRFSVRTRTFLQNISRHIVLEASVCALLAIALILYVAKMPLGFATKGELFISIASVLVLVHAIYSVLLDGAHRSIGLKEGANREDELDSPKRRLHVT